MKLKDIAELSCKILSITVLIKSIFHSHSLLNYFFRKDVYTVQPSLFQVSIIPVLLLILSIVLWCFAKNIASLMVKDTASLDKIINFEYNKIKPMIFSTIGLIILTTAFPIFARNLFTISDGFKNFSDIGFEVSMYELGYLVENFLKIVIAFYLICGSKGSKKVLSLLKSTRTLGQNFDEQK